MKKLMTLAALGGLVYAAKRYMDQHPEAQRRARDAGTRAQEEVRRATARARRRSARTGAGSGDDATVADRVRSQLGPLEKRLDVPRVQVTVVDGQVTLHGEVPTAEAARTIENAAREVRGVTGLESHLAVGLSSGATRPSESGPGDDTPLASTSGGGGAHARQ